MARLLCYIVALLFFTHSSVIASETKKTLVFGVVPQQSAAKLARSWRPILDYLQEKTQLSFVFATAKTIPIFEERLAKGDYDIAYMNPYHFTVFNQSPGYRAVAKQKDKRIKGIIVVKKDSTIEDISEIAGKKLAFPAPAAFAASVLPRAYFRSNGIPITSNYVSSHDSVYLSVAKGIFPAGGGVLRTFNNMDPEVRNQLRILWTTQDYTPHAIAIHPRIMPLKDSIQDALVGINKSTETKKLLKALNFKGIEPAIDQDWNDVRSLGIPLLNHLING